MDTSDFLENVWLWLTKKAYKLAIRVRIYHENEKGEAVQKALAKEGPRILGAGIFLGVLVVLGVVSLIYVSRNFR